MGVMQNVVAQWGGPERRTEPRKKKPFYIAYTINEVTYNPAYGLDISKPGMRVLTDVEMPPEFRLRVLFKEHEFIVGARKMWETEVPREDNMRWMAGVHFVVISQNDREFIECYVADKPYFAGNKLLEMLEELRKHPDNADRILPPEVLERFHRHLILRKRLVKREGESPLVRYHYDGPRQRNGQREHLMTIQSKVVEADKTREFTTKFVFNDTASSIEVMS
jgi:hypothetical protein